MTPADWMSSREFAKTLDVCEETIRRMCKNGTLTCAPISGKLSAKRFKWLVHRDAMDRFMASEG